MNRRVTAALAAAVLILFAVSASPADRPRPGAGTPLDSAQEQSWTQRARPPFPLMDLHVHIKGDLTLEEALARSKRDGITYGLAVNCGLHFAIADDSTCRRFLDAYVRPPGTFLAMQAEGREWPALFSEETRRRFDYVFTDAMTWTNRNGRRLRLWIPEETEVGDPQDFMEQLTAQIEKIFSSEPVDIYVNPTYLPDELAARYDEWWTTERMDRVIRVLKANEVALEINARRRLPSPAFIKRARAAGIRFTFGTNNAGADDLGRLEYCLEMVEECGLRASDLWWPDGRSR